MSAISGQTQEVAADWSALRSAPFNVLYRKYGAKGNGVADDTGAVQSAVNDAARTAQSSGIADVLLPAGFEFNLGQITLASGVRIWAYGALINPILAEINQGLLLWQAGNLSRFEVRGGTWQGTGAEGAGSPLQMLFQVISGNSCSDVRFADMTVNNWGTCVYYIRNPLRARVIDNTLQTIGQGGAAHYNAVNFVVDGTVNQGQKMLARGNIIDSDAAAIAYVNPNNSGPTDAKLTVTENLCDGHAASNNGISGAINVEQNGAAAVTFLDFLIALNHVNNPTNIGGLSWGIVTGGGGGGGKVGRTVIAKNTVVVPSPNGLGIDPVSSTDVSVTDNVISAGATPIANNPAIKTGNRYSAGPAQGRATLVAGAATVNTAEVRANDNIILSRVVSGGAVGSLSVGAITAGTSFTISSSSGTDTSTIYWRIDH